MATPSLDGQGDQQLARMHQMVEIEALLLQVENKHTEVCGLLDSILEKLDEL